MWIPIYNNYDTNMANNLNLWKLIWPSIPSMTPTPLMPSVKPFVSQKTTTNNLNLWKLTWWPVQPSLSPVIKQKSSQQQSLEIDKPFIPTKSLYITKDKVKNILDGLESNEQRLEAINTLSQKYIIEWFNDTPQAPIQYMPAEIKQWGIKWQLTQAWSTQFQPRSKSVPWTPYNLKTIWANVIPSLWNVALNIWEMIKNPWQTAWAIKDIAVWLPVAVWETIASNILWKEEFTKRKENILWKEWTVYDIYKSTQPWVAGVKWVWQYFKWYADPEIRKQRIEEDPMWVLSDVSSIMGVRWWAIEKAWQVSKLSKLAKAWQLMQWVSKLDPYNIVTQWTIKAWWQGLNIVKKWVSYVPKMTKATLWKMTWTSDDYGKLFKSAEPRTNQLNKSVDYKNLQKNHNIAAEEIVKAGYKPVDTASRAEAHANTMKKIRKEEIESKIGSNFRINLNPVADKIDEFVAKQKTAWLLKNEWQLAELKAQADKFRKMWEVDWADWEFIKEMLNSQINNRWDASLGDVYKNWLKEATKTLWQSLDDTFSAIPWQFAEAKKRFWALKATYQDVVKADIKAQKAKWLWLGETFWRIEWIGDILWAVGWLVTWKNPLPQLASWFGKLAVWKVLAKIKDKDFLIQEWFEWLSKKIPVANPINISKKGTQLWSPLLKQTTKAPTAITPSWIIQQTPVAPKPTPKTPKVLKPKAPMSKVEVAKKTPLKQASESVKNVDKESIKLQKEQIRQKQIVTDFSEKYWIDQEKLQKVATNIKRNNPWLTFDDAVAMGKDVIEWRKFNPITKWKTTPTRLPALPKK